MAADVVFVVDQGMEITTDRLLDSPNGNEPKWIDMGTGTTPATATDTVLETPGGEARTVGVMSQVTTTVTDDTLQVVGTITESDGGAAITECGLFTHLTSTTGFLYLRATFDAINLLDGNSIEFTIQVKYDQG
jgi:hypothetical protein